MAETIEIALTAAETGHLVLSTLHTIDASKTVERIVGSFEAGDQQTVRSRLAASFRYFISQRLIPMADGKGRVAALEVLVATSYIRELIGDKDRTKEIPEAIAKGYTSYGMQTFDQSLMSMLKHNLISYEEALRQCSSPDDFALRLKGISSTSDLSWEDFEKTGKGNKPGGGGGGGGQSEGGPGDMKIERF